MNDILAASGENASTVQREDVELHCETHMPKVSVVMPVYNGSRFLRQAIESVLSQTMQDLELICVNDGSTDDSCKIMKEYAERDGRFVLVSQENQGPGAALNNGVERAKGEYLAFIDQDDSFLPEHLASMLGALAECGTLAAIGMAEFQDEDGHSMGRVPYGKYLCCRSYDLSTVKRKSEFAVEFFPQWLKLVKREFWVGNGILFPSRDNKAHDIPVHILLVALLDKIAYTNKVTYRHRQHMSQITRDFEGKHKKYVVCSYADLLRKSRQMGAAGGIVRQLAEVLVERYYPRRFADRVQLFAAQFPEYPLRTVFRSLRDMVFKVTEKGDKVKYRILCFSYRAKRRKKSSCAGLPRPSLVLCGRNTYCAGKIAVANPAATEIGSFTSIGANCRLGNGIHPQTYLSTSPYFYFSCLKWNGGGVPYHDEWWDYAPIKIGNDVWIGDDVYIMNGVTVGDGAIIGARSLVRHDVPPYAIVVGSPARILRYRFPEEVVKELMELKWWELEDGILKTIRYDDIRKAISDLRQYRPQGKHQ